MHAASTASNSDRPPAPATSTRARRKRIDLDPDRMLYTVGECARAMGVHINTARRKLQARDALERIGGWDYTSKALIRRGWGRLAGEFIAMLEENRERDES